MLPGRRRGRPDPSLGPRWGAPPVSISSGSPHRGPRWRHASARDARRRPPSSSTPAAAAAAATDDDTCDVIFSLMYIPHRTEAISTSCCFLFTSRLLPDHILGANNDAAHSRLRVTPQPFFSCVCHEERWISPKGARTRLVFALAAASEALQTLLLAAMTCCAFSLFFVFYLT